jgi:amidase
MEPWSPSREELRRFSGEWGFELSDDELDQYAELTGQILAPVKAMNESATLSVDAAEGVRQVGARPSAEADPLNALVRECEIRIPGADGCLSGCRVAVKDSVSIAGVPLGAGSSLFDGYVPELDSVIVDRILRAGGEIVAMTSMDDLALSGGGESSARGPTLNPFDQTRPAGGSSAGSAACLHYDGIDEAVGADQGGSIRVPASWCGVIGLKPTHGLVPYTGILGLDQTLDHTGPLGRTTLDTARLLEAIAGADPSDPRQRQPQVESYIEAVDQSPDDLTGLRVGVLLEGCSPEVGATEQTRSAFAEFCERLREAGATLTEVSAPIHLETGGIAWPCYTEGFVALLRGGGNGYGWGGRYWEDLPPVLTEGLRQNGQDLSPQVKSCLLVGSWLSERFRGQVYAKAQNARPKVIEAYDSLLQGCDVLALPTTPFVAHPLAPDASIVEHAMRGWAPLANTGPFNVSGHPAISIPACEVDGLPLGVMLVGASYRDAQLLSIATTWERRYGWRPDRP